MTAEKSKTVFFLRNFLLVPVAFLLCTAGCSTFSTSSPAVFTPSLTFRYNHDISINYEKHGNGPKSIVILHGFGSSLRNWDDLLAALSKRGVPGGKYTIYLLDMKGAGFSSKPRDGHYSIRDFADILASFLKRQHISEPVIIGHSLGGGIALYATVEYLKGTDSYPSRLILVDTACYPADYPFFISFLRVPLLNIAIFKLLPDRYRATRTLNRIFVDKSAITPEIVDRYVYCHKMDNYPYALIQTAQQIMPDNVDALTAGYGKIKCPVDIIWGEKDNILPLELAFRLHKDIPDSQLTPLHGCGHDIPEECPEILAELISGSLSGK